MRLLKITTLYKSYWERFYLQDSLLANKSYQVQKEALDYDAFGWADFWSSALTSLGYEVMEVSANVEPLQKQWSLENNVDFNSSKWLWNTTFEQVKKFQPTIVFMDDYSTFTSQWINELRQACPAICLVICWCGAPFDDSNIFAAHDMVISCIPELVRQFREMGHRSEHMNHAFDPRLLSRLDTLTKPDLDCTFIGQIVRANQYHLRREQILEELVSLVPLQVYSPSAEFILTWKDLLKLAARSSLYDIGQALMSIGIPRSQLAKLPKLGKIVSLQSRPVNPVNKRLQPFMKPAVFGLEMFQTLRNSKLTLNCHIDISPHSASNMRLFEATGTGTCLVTDWKENIQELFEPDREVVTYKTAEECAEKVKWLLEHPQEREAIAKAGQARTLRDHTFTQRAIQLDEIIKRELAMKS